MEMTANGGALQSARIEARVDADGEEGKAAPAPTESKTPDQAAKTAPTPSSHEFLPSTSADPSAPSSPTPPPLHQRLGLLTTLINSYSRTQKRRSLLTNFFAAVITYFIGDLAAQRLGGWGSPDGEDYDAQRTLRNVVIGGAVSPFAYKWFVPTPHTFLFPCASHSFHPLTSHPPHNPQLTPLPPHDHRFLYLSLNFNAFSSKALNILLKVAINQAVFTPLFLTYYFAANALLSGATPGETVERVRRTVPTGMWNALKLWPAVTAVNLWAVPLEFRAVFAGVVAVGWQGYLSWLNRRAERGRKIREGVEMKAQE
ncbi:MAG: hypothetical protein LQ340_004881 [Diploschistes diacapsis]|nr:MAG: hypothetical protein LQ340_004881 [Diploschistes diacapsis]